MGTALLYLVVVVVVAAAFFAVASLVFGRGEELPPLAPDATPTRLPSGDIDGEDVRELRFPQAVRGYRMTEVDWVLSRLAEELDRAGAERDDLLGRLAELEARQMPERIPADEVPEPVTDPGPVRPPEADPNETTIDLTPAEERRR